MPLCSELLLAEFFAFAEIDYGAEFQTFERILFGLLSVTTGRVMISWLNSGVLVRK